MSTVLNSRFVFRPGSKLEERHILRGALRLKLPSVLRPFRRRSEQREVSRATMADAGNMVQAMPTTLDEPVSETIMRDLRQVRCSSCNPMLSRRFGKGHARGWAAEPRRFASPVSSGTAEPRRQKEA
eukprot:scaffold870_cov268-Pinguiococcus_pyrenoidosus.AAC.80